MKLSIHSHTLIESTIKKAIDRFAKDYCEQTVITDIHLQASQLSGELVIFDDNDEELSRVVIEEWIEYNGDDFIEKVESLLRTVLNKEKENCSFENLSLLRPFSFVLVDEEKETISELLLVDDDTMLVNDELLKGLDQELDDFLKELLKI